MSDSRCDEEEHDDDERSESSSCDDESSLSNKTISRNIFLNSNSIAAKRIISIIKVNVKYPKK